MGEENIVSKSEHSSYSTPIFSTFLLSNKNSECVCFVLLPSLKFAWGVFLVKGLLCGNPLAESPYWSGKSLKNFCLTWRQVGGGSWLIETHFTTVVVISVVNVNILSSQNFSSFF